MTRNAKTHGTLVGEALRDEAFRREWERLEIARVVAATVVAYRSDHDLSQRELAARLGWPQSQVGRLELAVRTPSHETLMRLAGCLGLEFNISIAPEHQQPKLLAQRAYKQAQVVSRTSRSEMRFMAKSA
jgi:transcriptional regulator with XRE-family HTH domain